MRCNAGFRPPYASRAAESPVAIARLIAAISAAASPWAIVTGLFAGGGEILRQAFRVAHRWPALTRSNLYHDFASGLRDDRPGLDSRCLRALRKGDVKFALSKAQVRLAQAAMAYRDTSVSVLCRELGISPVTLYRVRRTAGPAARAGPEGSRLLMTPACPPLNVGFRPLPQTTRRSGAAHARRRGAPPGEAHRDPGRRAGRIARGAPRGLPEGVTVEAGRIEVRFAGAKEAVVKLFALAQALTGDYERFEDLVGKGEQSG